MKASKFGTDAGISNRSLGIIGMIPKMGQDCYKYSNFVQI